MNGETSRTIADTARPSFITMWLDNLGGNPALNAGDREVVLALKAMLARPALPEADSAEEHELHRAICDRWPDPRVCNIGAAAASVMHTIRDHLTNRG